MELKRSYWKHLKKLWILLFYGGMIIFLLWAVEWRPSTGMTVVLIFIFVTLIVPLLLIHVNHYTRGPVDFTVSRGSKDKTVIEFKLAKSTKLKQNLQHQVEVYKKANDTDKAVIAILYFSQMEYLHLTTVLRELNLDSAENIILIDAQQKMSASNIEKTAIPYR